MELQLSIKKIIGIVFTLAIVVFVAASAGNLVENVDSNEIKIFQDPIDGDLHFHTTAGMKKQMFASIVRYEKRGQVEFTPPKNVDIDSKSAQQFGYRLRFNDQGGATLFGTISYTLPTDEGHLRLLREKYPSISMIENQLIRQALSKAIYMTGPTMSSKESTSEMRPFLLEYILDQGNEGAYQTKITEKKVTDTLSGEEKTITVAEIVEDPNSPNGRKRQEVSPLKEFGIKLFNFEIVKIRYDDAVQKQIDEQRQITMQIQTAKAQAKEAEQNAIKAEWEGKAIAEEAKWLQEKENYGEIAAAEKRKKVASLAAEEAEFYKTEKDLRADADANYNKKMIVSDGALKQKLATYERVMGKFAEEFGKQKWVPEIVMGANGKTGGTTNAATDLMNMLSTKTAMDLKVAVKPGK